MKFRIIAWGSVMASCTMLAAGWWYQSRPLLTTGITGADLRESKSITAPRTVRSGQPAVFPMPQPGTLSASVRQMMDPALNDGDRLMAIRTLVPAQLGSEDVDGLSAFLQKPEPQDGNMLGQAFKNKIMDLLGELDAPRYPALMAGIYQDKSRDPVIRDYALQHLIEYYERRTGSGGGRLVPNGEWRQAAQVLWHAVTETDSSIAGTALLGLSRLSADQPLFDRERIGALASQLTSDENTAQFTRITAIQVSAKMGMREALPAIWEVAQSSASPPLQISAIGALGVMGESKAIPFLTDVLNSASEYLKPAAQKALQQIAKMEQQKARELEEKAEGARQL